VLKWNLFIAFNNKSRNVFIFLRCGVWFQFKSCWTFWIFKTMWLRCGWSATDLFLPSVAETSLQKIFTLNKKNIALLVGKFCVATYSAFLKIWCFYLKYAWFHLNPIIDNNHSKYSRRWFNSELKNTRHSNNPPPLKYNCKPTSCLCMTLVFGNKPRRMYKVLQSFVKHRSCHFQR
jgi:hypothetical protein